jgi:hypothetical protein
MLDEEAQDQTIRPRCAGCKESKPPLVPERLPDPLKWLPSLASRYWQGEPHVCELSRIAQISDVDAWHSMAPDVARQLLRWRQTTLGQVAVPLGPQSALVVG